MTQKQYIQSAEKYVKHNIVDFVAHTVKHFPDNAAIKYQQKQLTYRQLDVISSSIANYLAAQGVKPGHMVGICLPRSMKLPVAILAILKCGAAYVPFDSEYPRERIQYMQQTAGVKYLITNNSLKGIFDNAELTLLDIDDIIDNSERVKDTAFNATTHPNLCYVLFTSGSTGMPKGVAMGHGALINLMHWQMRTSQAFTNSQTLQFAPISFDVSFQEIFSTWASGGTLVMIDDDLRLNAPHLLTFLEEQKISRLFLPFIALQHLADVAMVHHRQIDNLVEVITAGEQLQVTPALVSFFETNPQAVLWNHYGPTETHVVTAYQLQGAPSTWPALPAIGVAIDNCSVLLLDENLQPVNQGQEGELYAAGACVAEGYINNEVLTNERFITHEIGGKKVRIYKTGDIARMMGDGNLQYLGRADGQVKVRGYRIELGEVENALSKHSNVYLCAVTVREDVPGNKRLVAYIVPRDNKSYNISVLRKHVANTLPDYMQPSAYVMMDDLPRTPSGKIDRKTLPPPQMQRPAIDTEYVAPTGEIEKQLAQLWCTILDIDKAGVDDNFFELGGNSLLALKFTSSLLQYHGIDIPVTTVFQTPTIAALSQFILHGNDDTDVLLNSKARFRGTHASAVNTVEDGVAIIGMACKFPGANTIAEFWQNLKEGKETITFFNDNELDASIPKHVRNDANYIKARGIVQGVKQFDAAYFGINPKVAAVTDPQHRILLQLAVEALEHAGVNYFATSQLIGVYAGTGNNTYYLKNVLPYDEVIAQVGDFLTMTSNEKDYIATRIAYELNLKGPALSIHTACSTSLVAVVTATDQLLEGKCDVAIAGGVAITSPVMSGYMYNEGSMNSADGHCRPFDKDARGTMFSDGAGIVVLKRYSDAVRDGDTIYAVIRGGALNNDGGEKASFTAPSADGQAQVIAMAQAKANVTAETISYVEAHGTATPIGDPIEVAGLTKAFQLEKMLIGTCGLGSVKSNFGHLTAAAGVAGLIKVALQLHHKQLVPTLNFRSPNPAIKFEQTPFKVIHTLQPWTAVSMPRRAGISSFGVGGTNAHLIVEEAPAQTVSGSARPAHVLFISAKSEQALARYKQQLCNDVLACPDMNAADIAYTFQTGRPRFAHRSFITYTDSAQLCELLMKPAAKISQTYKYNGQPPVVGFMFPGQGSQYINMGKALYDDEIIFRQHADMCFDLFASVTNISLREVLFSDSPEGETLLKQTQYTQPALFTIGYALSKLYMSWGVAPQLLIGHSIGEFAAACIAGVFSLRDAVLLVGTRATLMQQMPAGSMLSVRMSAEQILPMLNARCAIAAINGNELCVVSGPTDDVAALQKTLEAEDVVCKALHTSHAFHSPMMDDVLPLFAQTVGQVKLTAPKIKIYSTVYARLLSDSEATDAQYWATHLRVPVRFAEAAKQLWNDVPQAVLLECGPRNTASQMAKQQANDMANQFAIASLPDKYDYRQEWTTMCSAIGQLWLKGVDINFKNYYAIEQRKHIACTTYPFDTKEHWLNIPTGHDEASPRIGLLNVEGDNETARQLVTQQLQLMQQHLQLIKQIQQK